MKVILINIPKLINIGQFGPQEAENGNRLRKAKKNILLTLAMRLKGIIKEYKHINHP